MITLLSQRQRWAKGSARYRKTHPERHIQAVRNWENRNPEKCRKYKRESSTKYRKLHPETVSERSWRRAGIVDFTETDYQKMLEAQKGLCAICRKPPGSKRLHADHVHETGIVRGLLCNKCNFGIGQFDDSVLLMESAIAYVKAGIVLR